MSDHLLRLLPAAAHWLPTQAVQASAVQLLRQALPAAEAVLVQRHPQTRFVDAGGNWAGVRCPACGQDAEAWWAAAMGQAAAGGFADLGVRAGCCGAAVGLDALRYGWPVGFAMFWLDLRNPGMATLPTPVRQALVDVLGCQVLEVSAHV